MHDDQRRNGDKHHDEEERFDDALDDVFGLDEDDPGNTALPPAADTEPARQAATPRAHDESDDETQRDHESLRPVDDTRDSGSAGEPPRPHRTASTATTPTAGRNWRRIASFGCLAAVGIPALCLATLVVIGLVVGDPTATPTPPSVQIESTPASAPSRLDSAGSSGVEVGDHTAPQRESLLRVISKPPAA